MEDYVILAILVVVIGAAIMYIIRAKKNGVKCIGCPAGGSCGQKRDGLSCDGCSGCNGSICSGEEKESSESRCCNCQSGK